MARAAVCKRIPKDIPPLAAGRRFGRYKKEAEKAVRKADVKHSEGLEQIMKAWDAYKERWRSEGYLLGYRRVSDFLKDLEYDAEDVGKFCVALAAHQEEFQDKDGSFGRIKSKHLGTFLSALINNGNGNDFHICTKHLLFPIGDLCYENTKNVVIEGDVGENLGEFMKSGKIIVNNTGEFTGYHMKGGEILVEGEVGNCLGCGMEDGSITVKGNAGDSVGLSMKGGKIVVNNAGREVGKSMTGGEIQVEGSYRSIGDMKDGISELAEVSFQCLAKVAMAGTVVLGGIAAFMTDNPVTAVWSGLGAVVSLIGTVWFARTWKDDARCLAHCLKYPREIYGGEIYHKGKLIYHRKPRNEL